MILFRPIQHLYGHLYFHDARGILVTREIIKEKIRRIVFQFFMSILYLYFIFFSHICAMMSSAVFLHTIEEESHEYK
jgi:hypothetical protein